MSDRVTSRLVIRGRVQGVFYRESMRVEASRLGVAGWVRNRGDGCVEAVVQGTAAAVAAIVAWAHRGPADAQVSAVEQHPAEGSYSAFEKRPTE